MFYCEAQKVLEVGRMHTFSRLIESADQCKKGGSDLKKMQHFANVIDMPLIKVEGDQFVWEAVPPPELHCMMGAINHPLALARRFLERNGLKEELWKWCDGKGITR